MTRNCFCEITTDPVVSVCLFYPCFSCQSRYHCTSGPCFCIDVSVPPVQCSCTDQNAGSSQKCNPISAMRKCPLGRDKTYSCQTSTDFILEPPNDCRNGQNTEGFVFGLQLKVTGMWNCFICM